MPLPLRFILGAALDLYRGRPVAPGPAENIGENLTGVLLIVAAFAPGVVHVVAIQVRLLSIIWLAIHQSPL